MIIDITHDIMYICKSLIIDYEKPSKILLYHYILQFIFDKVKEENKISAFFIRKSNISVFFKEITQIFKNFPIYTIISDEKPEETDEFNCIIDKHQHNLEKNIKKLRKFLIKNQLSFLKDMFTCNNIGLQCVARTFAA